MYIYRIVCAVLTARGSDIIKTTVLTTPGSVCENCEADGHAHHTSKNPTKCIHCGKDHSPQSNICEVWLKEKAIMKLKVTNNIRQITSATWKLKNAR